MQFQAEMFKTILIRFKGNNFIKECMLFHSRIPYYWLLGIMGWTSFILFIYAGLALMSLGT